MNYIPAQKPFAEGKTVKEAIVASIFPRFLMPNKAISGGVENMKDYAGIQLGKGTSMDIGQIGEAYANYGIYGGIVFMFLLGLLLNWVLNFIEKKQLRYPDLIFWMPFIFLQIVKAESSLVTILNHLVKASIIVWALYTPLGQRVINYLMGIIPSKK